jgi:uncharacterized membrane protein YgdD (TMEM256/DUF423 family)
MILAITIKRIAALSRAYGRHAVRRTVLWRLVDMFGTAIALVGMAAIAVLAMHVFN